LAKTAAEIANSGVAAVKTASTNCKIGLGRFLWNTAALLLAIGRADGIQRDLRDFYDYEIK